MHPNPRHHLLWIHILVVLLLFAGIAACSSPSVTQPPNVSLELLTVTPTNTATATSTSTPTPTPSPVLTKTPIPPIQSGNPPQITSFIAQKTQDNSVLFTWAAIGISADICPLLDTETLYHDCKQIYRQFYEAEIVGSEIWPAAEIGAIYTGFRLAVEGSNGVSQSAEISISGLACAQEWFFNNPTERCPTPSVTSFATAQRFEHGQMIWIQKLDKFYIFYDSGLQAWPTNLDIVWPLTLKPNASLDNQVRETPPPGYIEPAGNFGLIWRGEAEGTEGVRQRLGWAKEPKIGFRTIYQCGVGSDNCAYYPGYLRDPEGKILNLYYLMHFGLYWEEEFNFTN